MTKEAILNEYAGGLNIREAEKVLKAMDEYTVQKLNEFATFIMNGYEWSGVHEGKWFNAERIPIKYMTTDEFVQLFLPSP